MLRPNDSGAMNDMCLHCEKPVCPGICDELRETMGEVEHSQRGQTLTWHGITRTISEWAEVFGMTPKALRSRLKGTSDVELIMDAIASEKPTGGPPGPYMEQTYLRLSTMHIDYELYWKRLSISEGSAGLVARYGAVQSAPTNRTSNPTERRAMPEITISDEALERRSWVACVLYVIEAYRSKPRTGGHENNKLKARLLEWRAIDGWTMRRICDQLNSERSEYEAPMTIMRLRKFFQSVVVDITKEAQLRGLYRDTQK